MRVSSLLSFASSLLLMRLNWLPHTRWPNLYNATLHQNTYTRMTAAFAQHMGLRDCWICTQVSHHGAGLPWRGILANWSDICGDLIRKNHTFNWEGKRQTAFATNCTKKAKYGLLNTTWRPQFPAGTPTPILIHPLPPGVLCYAQSRTPTHTWEAGYSSCSYTVTGTQNTTIPIINQMGQIEGEAQLSFSCRMAQRVNMG